MRLEIVRRIVCEKDNSQLVPSRPRNDLQQLRLSGLYELLALLRIVLTLNLQTGWIHQDEFTNSLEVVAGDFFDLQVYKSPAFNSTFPTHSPALTHLTIYFPYVLFKKLLIYYDETGKEILPDSRYMILIPRLVYVALSFLVDYILVKFCELNASKPKDEDEEDKKESEMLDHIEGERPRNQSQADSTSNDYSIRLVTLASSQVVLVFTSRTHAAAINLLLFSLMLYLISDAFHQLDRYIRILEKYDKTKNPVEKVNFLRQMKRTGYSSVTNLPSITAVVVIGLWNDFDFFFVYSSVPLFFYMQRGISHRLIGLKYFHARCFTFIGLFLVFSVPFILCDSLYYGRVALNDLMNLNLTPESFVVIPANYYASKSYGFKDISAYPKIFLSFLALFNILGIMGITSFLKEAYDFIFSEWRNKPTVDSHWTFLNCSLFLPLLLLIQGKPNFSSFDLVPLIFPLVYMHGHKIPLVSRFSSYIGLAWFVSNFIGIIFWGYVSQGGIVSSFLDISAELRPLRYNNTHVDITFSQMSAIPPTFVLAIPSKWKTLLETPNVYIDNGDEAMPSQLYRTVLRLESANKVRVYHTGVSPLPMSHLETDLIRLIHNRENEKVERDLMVNFLVLPYSYGKEGQESFKKLRLKHVKTYWNHISINLWGEETKVSSLAEIGLSIYRMERTSDKIKNVTANDSKFTQIFKFHEAFYDFIGLIVNAFSLLLSCALFLMSYLVFMQ